MSISRTPKLMNYINYRMRATLTDNRYIIGRFMAFDRHMNIVLGDSEEYRKLPPKKGREEREERRVLGLVLIRGEEVVSLKIEGQPPQEEARFDRGQLAASGPGVGRAAGRGLPVPIPGQAPGGLAGPARGVGGPAPGVMLPRPQMQAPPMIHPPPMARPGMPPVMPPPSGAPPIGMPPPGAAPTIRMTAPGAFPPPQFRPGMPPPASMPPPSHPPPRPPQ
eukprot:g8825.t1